MSMFFETSCIIVSQCAKNFSEIVIFGHKFQFHFTLDAG